MKTLAFGASNSRMSINKALATHAAEVLADEVMQTDIEIIDLNSFEAPFYSPEYEELHGVPESVKALKAKVIAADQIIISFAEHNGSYVAFYKNLFDWMSRMEGPVFDGKKMVLMATSPGGKGAASVLAQAETSMPFFGATVAATLSVPKFHEVFDREEGQLIDDELKAALREALSTLK